MLRVPRDRSDFRRGWPRRAAPACAALLLAAEALTASPKPTWPQFGGNPQHTGSVPVYARGLQRILADIVYDPFVELEKADGGGDLFVHYAVPLVDGDSVYMAFKSGTYSVFGSFDTLISAGRVNDAGTSSPVVLPDGAVLVGANTSYNYGRGHLFKFDANGSALATYDFGWDITPAVLSHNGTYSIRIKDNHYSGPPGEQGRYQEVSLDAALLPEWEFASTNTQTCAHQQDSSIVCVDDQPEGFEWCVNQPAIDASDVTYLNSEDGNLYALDSNGVEVGRIFLDQALGAAYTPIAIGSDGVIYAQNNGRLFVVGFTGEPRPAPVVTGSRAGTRTAERLSE